MQRDGRKSGDVHEVGEVPLEIFFVGENGHAGGSAFDVALGLADGIKIGIDDAGGGGGFFDLGNDAKLVGSAVEGSPETTEVISHQGGGPEFFGEGNEGFDLLFLIGDDFVQLVHRRAQ